MLHELNFQMFKLDLDKAEEPEIKLPTSVGSLKKQDSTLLKKVHIVKAMKAGREGDDRGLDGWMASLTRWT